MTNNSDRGGARPRRTQPSRRSTAWVRENPQTENNAKEMAAARDLAARKRRFEPITVKEFAKQEGLSVTDARRKLALASLPAAVQALVAERKLAIMSAEHIATAHLEAHEKMAVAEKIASGTLSREAVRDCVRALATWSEEARSRYLTDPGMAFDEARELFLHEERARRERDQVEDRRRRALRSGSRQPHWVALTAVNQFNQVANEISKRPNGVDPTVIDYAGEILLDALDSGAAALVALGHDSKLRNKLHGLLADLDAAHQLDRSSTIVPGSIISNAAPPDPTDATPTTRG